MMEQVLDMTAHQSSSVQSGGTITSPAEKIIILKNKKSTPTKPVTASQNLRGSDHRKFGARKLVMNHQERDVSPMVDEMAAEHPSQIGIDRGLELVKQTTQDTAKTDLITITTKTTKAVKKHARHKRA